MTANDGGGDTVGSTVADSGAETGGVDLSAIKCQSKNDCSGGQICCSETTKFGTLCQSDPCGKTLLGYPVQLCATSAECLNPGEVCSPFVAVGIPIVTCQAPADAAAEAGSSTDGPAAAGDAAMSMDAATNGD